MLTMKINYVDLSTENTSQKNSSSVYISIYMINAFCCVFLISILRITISKVVLRLYNVNV